MRFADTNTRQRREGMEDLKQVLADDARKGGRMPDSRAIDRQAEKIASRAERGAVKAKRK